MSEQEFVLEANMHVHLIGIGGSGMSAIAQVLQGRGFVISGSDMSLNGMTAVLQEKGITVYEGHLADQITGADVVVISSAIPATNPELLAAKTEAIPVLKRAQLLGLLMQERIGIAVAGTHGKTSTTGMIAQILMEAELDPTVIVGGVLPSLGSNGRFGEGDYFIVEADEYDRMFLGLKPELIVVTSLEHDHPDIYATEGEYMAAFAQFAALLPVGGHLVACGADAGVQKLLAQLQLEGVDVSTYGIAAEEKNAHVFDFQAVDCRPNQLGGTDFLLETEGEMVGLARLRVPGEHNVLNALAAATVALDLGIDFNVIRTALAKFNGINRRFQIIGEVGGVTVVDDYAHHPTEIQATLKAARQRFPGRRLWAIWQPHTYSRTKLLLDTFATSFVDADRVVALDIYRSRETDTLGMDTAVVVQAMKHPHAVHVGERRAAADYVLDRIYPDDVVITLGAGDGNVVGEWILQGLEERLKIRG